MAEMRLVVYTLSWDEPPAPGNYITYPTGPGEGKSSTQKSAKQDVVSEFPEGSIESMCLDFIQTIENSNT